MGRSLKKGVYIYPKLLKKIKKVQPGSNTVIKTWYRAAVILPEMVGYTFGVHNGKEHVKVKVADNMVGHRLGEFAPTKVWNGHGGKKAREEASA